MSRGACAYAESYESLCCSYAQNLEVDECLVQNLDL